MIPVTQTNFEVYPPSLAASAPSEPRREDVVTASQAEDSIDTVKA